MCNNNYQFFISKKKNIFNFIIETPIFIYNFFFIFQKIFLKKKLNKVFKKSLKTIILANGPSLSKSINRIKLIKLKKKTQIITVNTLPSKKFFFELKPDFHCMIDSAFLKNYSLLNKGISNSIKNTFKNLNRINWQLTVFVPYGSKKIIKKYLTNINIFIIELPSINYDFESSLYLKWASYFEMPPPRVNVTVTSVYLALLSGVMKIEIYGADMTTFKDFDINQYNNSGYMIFKHFSNSKNDQYALTNKLKKKKADSLYIRLIRAASCFKWFAYLSMIAKKKNIKLKNKSFYSLIDSIER
jgi:hypothetical protein